MDFKTLLGLRKEMHNNPKKVADIIEKDLNKPKIKVEKLKKPAKKVVKKTVKKTTTKKGLRKLVK